MIYVNRLKQLRVERRLTIRQLGEKVGISYVTISRLESEVRPFTLDHLTRLSQFFDCSFDYILGKSDVRQPANAASEKSDVSLAFYNQHGIVSEEQKKEIENFIAFVKSRDNKK